MDLYMVVAILMPILPTTELSQVRNGFQQQMLEIQPHEFVYDEPLGLTINQALPKNGIQKILSFFTRRRPSQISPNKNTSLSLTRRGALPSPKQIFNIFQESVVEHLNFDKILNQQLNALDNLLRRSNLLPLGLRAPRIPFLPDLSVLRQLFDKGRQNARSTAICHACRAGFALFLMKARSGIAFTELQEMAIFGCQFFKIASSEVCTGLVKMYAPILQYIGKVRPDLTPDRFCGVVLQSHGCISLDRQDYEWTVDLGPDDYIEYYDDRDPVIPDDTKTLKIIHLADLHIDPHYRVGADAVCKHELCCRGHMAMKPENQAGYFGDLRKCDLPYHTFQATLEHLSETHSDAKLVYMTGDLVPHDVWSTKASTNVEILQNVTHMIKTYLPNARIVPVIGNHESHPVNMFPPAGVPKRFSVQWLYDAASLAWKDWIPPESMKTFLKSGYYHMKPFPGFRVIIMNINLCYNFNFWQLYEFRDPGGQLKWLINVLRKSRNQRERVHIVSHVPPGQDECDAIWSRNFYEIIHAFRDVVKSQFYAHTHYDEFQLYYHKEAKDVPVNTIWMGPSLSPFTNLNPGYKIYKVDGTRALRESTWNVLDFETWTFDLKQANKFRFKRKKIAGVQPNWARLYSATQAYQIPNVLPRSLDGLIQQFSKNETWFNLYYRYYYKDTKESLEEPCDLICRKRLLCNIVTPHYNGQKECMELESGVDGVILPKMIFEKFRSNILSPISKGGKKLLSSIGLG